MPANLNLSILSHVKVAIGATPSSNNGNSSSFVGPGSVQRPWIANFVHFVEHYKVAKDGHAIIGTRDEGLNVTMEGLVQARRVGARGLQKKKNSDGVVGKYQVSNSGKKAHRELEMYITYEQVLILEMLIRI